MISQARLPEIVDLAKKYDALTMVDDAHGEGVLGTGGRGVVNHFNLEGEVRPRLKKKTRWGEYSALTHTRHHTRRIPGIPGSAKRRFFFSSRGRDVYYSPRWTSRSAACPRHSRSWGP